MIIDHCPQSRMNILQASVIMTMSMTRPFKLMLKIMTKHDRGIHVMSYPIISPDSHHSDGRVLCGDTSITRSLPKLCQRLTRTCITKSGLKCLLLYLTNHTRNHYYPCLRPCTNIE